MSLNHALVLPGAMAAAAVLVAVASLLLLREASRRDLEIRIDTVVSGAKTRSTSVSARHFVAILDFLRTIGQSIRTRTHLYSENDLAALEGMLVAGGFNPKRFVSVVLGAKIVLLILAPVLAIVCGALLGLSPVGRWWQAFLLVCSGRSGSCGRCADRM